MKKPDRERHEQPAKPSRISRRNLLKTTPLALAAGSIAVPPLLNNLAGKANAQATSDNLIVVPRYYPLDPGGFRPEINLNNKCAVITGASRGNGRAVGEALAALGVDVIGTSRNPSRVTNPPSFPLLPLDITNNDSVFAFVQALQSHNSFRKRGFVDILVNNAGRNVTGRISPVSPADLEFYLAQRDLGVRTLYTGHIMVTNALLPLMKQNGYARIVFTVSATSYFSGAALDMGLGSYTDVYFSSKTALRIYANNLRAALRAARSSIRVSTVNPYVMKTDIAKHPYPIYTQPVDINTGLSPKDSRGLPTDPTFDLVIQGTRGLVDNGLDPAMVGTTYAQLLSMAEPEWNVVVGSPREPLATKGWNAVIEGQVLADNQISAIPLKCV